VATRKSDLVRRSLFGSGEADQAASSNSTGARRSRRGAEEATSAPRSRKPGVQPEPESVPASDRRKVERTAVTVPTDLLLRVKDAVAVLNGWPYQYTMARFVEEAFAAHLEQLKAKHNGGREFPITNRKIRTGRPPGS
jgi:hypothetical protein